MMKSILKMKTMQMLNIKNLNIILETFKMKMKVASAVSQVKMNSSQVAIKVL
jgi:hypothetical protein